MQAFPGPQDQRQLPALRTRPPVQVLADVVDLPAHETQLRGVRLEPRLAEVLPQRLGEGVLLLDEHPLERVELGEPPLEGSGPA